LTSLIIKAKAHWEYPKEWLDAWKSDLKITPSFIEGNEVVLLTTEEITIGFFWS
jgi:hypothetical protein